jgi:general secretion pathway protein D
VDLLESALSVNGAVIVKRSNDYQIVPSSEAFSSVPSVSGSGAALKGPGVKVQVIGLKFVAADEMKSILDPISRQGSVLRTDPARNLIVIAGNGSDLAAMREAISVFDVDWMRGMSVALTPLKASKPAAVAKELDTIFATDTSLGKGVIRFIPNDRLNSVLVITSRPAYLERARLDREARSSGEFDRAAAVCLSDPKSTSERAGGSLAKRPEGPRLRL